MFNLLHNIMNQKLFEKHLCNSRIPHQKKKNVTVYTSYQLSSEKWSIQYTSLPAMLNLLHSSTNQDCLKSTTAIKVSTIKNRDN